MSSFRYKATLLLAALVVCTAAGGAFAAEDLLKKVKSAIQQAEKDGIPPKDQACKLPYDDAHMSAILLAIGDYFSKPASRALNARLQFKPDYRDGGNQTQIIRRPVRQNPNYRRLGGDYEMVEIKKTNSQAVLT